MLSNHQWGVFVKSAHHSCNPLLQSVYSHFHQTKVLCINQVDMRTPDSKCFSLDNRPKIKLFVLTEMALQQSPVYLNHFVYRRSVCFLLTVFTLWIKTSLKACIKASILKIYPLFLQQCREDHKKLDTECLIYKQQYLHM